MSQSLLRSLELTDKIFDLLVNSDIVMIDCSRRPALESENA